MTNITVTVGNTAFPGVLYDNAAAKELLSRLPAHFSLSQGSRDYCGNMGTVLPHEEKDVQRGYRNGDLAWWLPGNDFVIFTEREESSGEVEGCVILGRLLSGSGGNSGYGPFHHSDRDGKVKTHLWNILNETTAFRQQGEAKMNILHVRRVFLALLCIVTMLGCNSAWAREDNEMAQGIPVKITVGNQVLRATFLDNATKQSARGPFSADCLHDGSLWPGNVLPLPRCSPRR